MMVYLDTSALLRLLDENHPSSNAIINFLDERDLWNAIVISDLNRLECERVAVREELAGNTEVAASIRSAMTALKSNDEISIGKKTMARAMSIPVHVKSLDALHIGLALDCAADVLVTYDTQMEAAAASLLSHNKWSGLNYEVVSP